MRYSRGRLVQLIDQAEAVAIRANGCLDRKRKSTPLANSDQWLG